MDNLSMVLMLMALACPLVALLLLMVEEAFGWSKAEAAVPYVFAASAACLLAAIIGVVWGVLRG